MEKQSNYLARIWLALAIIIAVLMPIYGAWHHVFTLGICVVMYLAFKGEGKTNKISD